MKKLIFISLVIITIFSVSCTEDFTNPKTLSGTTWRCSSFAEDDWMKNEYEYVEMRFISTTQIEGWAKWIDGDLSKSGIANYTISGNTITFISEPSNTTETGTIDKEKMTINESGHILVFIKQ